MCRYCKARCYLRLGIRNGADGRTRIFCYTCVHHHDNKTCGKKFHHRTSEKIVWYFTVHCLMRCEITTVGSTIITLFEDITPGSVENRHQCLGNMYFVYLLVTYRGGSRSRRSIGCCLPDYYTSYRRKANLQLAIVR